MDAEELLRARLAQLSESFAQGLGQRLADLRAAWEQACKGDADALEELRRHAHSLKGSGTTFGFPEVSHAAAALEEAAKRWGADSGPEAAQRTRALLEELARTCRRPAGREGNS